MSVPSVNINKVCLSGLNTIYLADQMIASGEADIVVAGGMESMTNAPYIASGARGGFRYGNTELADAIVKDGLWCAFDACLMGLGTERYSGGGITREQQDDLAMKSNQRAAAAIAAGRLTDEIVPVSIPQRKGDPKIVDTDEGVRADTTMEGLAKLRPAFSTTGTVTAGNSSQTSDGAAASVLVSDERAKKLGLKPLAIFRSFVVVGCDPDIMGIGPAFAIPKLLDKTGLKLEQIDLIELNEAFASQAVYVIRTLGLDPAKVNVNGGAIALGHPLGCTGAKLTATLVHEMGRRRARYGIVSMCIGGGMGAAGLFERPS
jgi:acetyl-CoA C-acetyltransferase